ncbi:hypothetical protein MIDIC_240009 [Alphaproteobacteria bacterium]
MYEAQGCGVLIMKSNNFVDSSFRKGKNRYCSVRTYVKERN